LEPEDDQSEFSATQLLLVTDVLIGGNYHVEPDIFRHPYYKDSAYVSRWVKDD